MKISDISIVDILQTKQKKVSYLFLKSFVKTAAEITDLYDLKTLLQTDIKICYHQLYEF